uniref:cartilage intermediate layer protein 1-like isoform X2 n=1 Tax=Styela clava TaxID=7725 RepID=UPI0019399129|nr:cartilage intermediate layer protein 1-like isoform X2 [Styela clava]
MRVILLFALLAILVDSSYSRSQEIIACQGDELEIACENNNTVIYIEDAFYGRKNMSVCADPNSELNQVHCIASKSLPRVFSKCHMKKSCTIEATNEMFEVDPCPRLRNYLQIQYRCAERGTDILGECPFEFWYRWMNGDSPSGTGDYETFYRHKHELPKWCESPDAVQIQLADGSPIHTRNDVIKTGAQYGISCSNVHQDGSTCGDYKARFCCSSDCAIEIAEGNEGTISSPNYPDKYEPNTDCSWMFKTSYDRYFLFTITNLQLEYRNKCVFDHLSITDLLTRKEVFHDCKLTGNSSVIEVSGNRAQIRFITDRDNEGQGFQINWKTVKVPVCTPPSAPLSGGFDPIEQALWRVGTVVVYRCDEYFLMEGQAIVQCKANRKWSHPRPLCKAECAPVPNDYFQRMPDFCTKADGSPKFVNVGKCSKNKCKSKKKIGLDKANCCEAVETETTNVDCGSFYVPITKTIRCECGECVEDELIISGIVAGGNNEEAVINGSVKYLDEVVATTDESGQFLFSLKTSKTKISLTFLDYSTRKFLPKTQIIEISPGQQKFVKVQMKKKPPVVYLKSNVESKIDLKSGSPDDYEENIQPLVGEVVIAPGSIKDGNGNVYEGEVEMYAHLVDNGNPESWKEAPGPFMAASNEDEDELEALENYGIFQFQINSPEHEPLEVENMEIKINVSHVEKEQLDKLGMYYFDNAKGVWQEDAPMLIYHDESARDEKSTFLIGNINVTVDRIWSLNAVVNEYCYAKVRTYASSNFDHRDQMDGVSVRAVYMGDDGRWKGFSSEMTMDGSGACIMVPCTGKSRELRLIHVTATDNDAKELWAVSSKPFRPKNAGFSKYISNVLKYRRRDHDDRKLDKTSFNITIAKNFDSRDRWYGPIYASSSAERCFLAPPTDDHFRFYKQTEGIRGKSAITTEYNAIPSDGDSEDPRYWGEYDNYNQVCFIKVATRGSRRILMRATSSGGIHPNVTGQLYGFRQKFVSGGEDMSSACIEFKCPGSRHEFTFMTFP